MLNLNPISIPRVCIPLAFVKGWVGICEYSKPLILPIDHLPKVFVAATIHDESDPIALASFVLAYLFHLFPVYARDKSYTFDLFIFIEVSLHDITFW